ncbi:hypothetical protein OG785_28790 [Streptomyces sp. NBC_00006]|uniref:hypothetical protein n=1 Tax=unclassified Streptomyces TaxID=2593676 RepID=UPI00224CEE6C|nr:MULTISPECIES: hypothetical protein [unclassified Streptomyces]MCX4833560.1 hypothetical protein [Streptomyces sp. NBC_01016]MCX5534542.1 hypothetical protein [Streptomyces sp. NBC_00006]
MAVAITSLKYESARTGPQSLVYDNDGYHLVRFPYAAAEESYDPWTMHDPAGGGGSSRYPDARSGLIWPSHNGWGTLSALVFWDADTRASEYRARFVRDPLRLSTGYDSTATTDISPTGGGQYRSYTWQMFVHPGTPLGFKVSARSGDTALKVPITLAEFKLAIQTDVITP